jgi:hypothetical protein
MTCLLPPLCQSTPTLQAALQKHAGVFFCPQLRHPLNDLFTTASPPVHANSSGSASETCRCVLLPSAQTPLNDLSTTASPPAHLNSLDSASETCRCVLLPSAEAPFNDLSTTMCTSPPAHANSSGSASETCRCVLLPSAQTPCNDLSTTTSQLVHANFLNTASETCRCVLLPSAQTPLNDLSTIYHLSSSPRQHFIQRFRNIQVCSLALSSDTHLITCLLPRLLVKREMLNRGLNRGRGLGIDEAFFLGFMFEPQNRRELSNFAQTRSRSRREVF